MRDALPPPGFVSSVPSMPSPRGTLGSTGLLVHRARWKQRATPRGTHSPHSTPPPAAHTAPRGIHRAPPVGSEPEGGLASGPAPGTLTHGWTAVYPVYTSRIQPWEWNTGPCGGGDGGAGGAVGQCCRGRRTQTSPRDSVRESRGPQAASGVPGSVWG